MAVAGNGQILRGGRWPGICEPESVPVLHAPLSLCDAGRVSGSPEAVFQALDGQECEIDGTPCHVEVYGVWEDGEHRWVQLAVDHYQMLTLRLWDPLSPECALVSAAARS